MLGATVGAAALWLSGMGQSYAQSWQIWWSSNAMAILLITPLVLACAFTPARADGSNRPARPAGGCWKPSCWSPRIWWAAPGT
jgi:integral membrane sensor domain MASE1